MNQKDEKKIESSEAPTCPYCGYNTQHWDDVPGDFYAESTEIDITCSSCHKEYKLMVEVQHLWTTWKK